MILARSCFDFDSILGGFGLGFDSILAGFRLDSDAILVGFWLDFELISARLGLEELSQLSRDLLRSHLDLLGTS